jgi:hypothetical protein
MEILRPSPRVNSQHHAPGYRVESLLGSLSSTLYDPADLVLHEDRLLLLDDESSSSHKYISLESLVLLASGLKGQMDDCRTVNNVLQSSYNTADEHESPNSVDFASALPPMIALRSRVISITP